MHNDHGGIMKYSYLLLLLILLQTVSIAEEQKFEYDDMSLDAISSLDVKVASKKDEKLADAPGSITLYTSEDIKKYGYYTLADLASITPGFSVASQFGEKGLESRGIPADPWNNNKYLIMVDDIPVRHIRANKALIDQQFPIFYADKVEFLRGPASALYGVGAFNGVLNITTTPLKESGAMAQNRVSLGSEDNLVRNYSSFKMKNVTGIFDGAFSFYQKDASKTPLLIPNAVDIKYYDDDQSLFFKTKYQFTTSILSGVTVGSMYSKKTGGIGEYWSGVQNFEGANVIWETALNFIKVNKSIGDKLKLNGYFSLTNSSENGFTLSSKVSDISLAGDSIFINKKDTTSLNDSLIILKNGIITTPTVEVGEYNDELRAFEYLLEGDLSIAKNFDIIVGTNILSRKKLGAADNTYAWGISGDEIGNSVTKNNSFAIETPFAHTFSGYIQVQNRFPVLNGLSTIAGVREDYGTYEENSYSQLSPRLGIVQRFTNQMNMKILYGTALKAPGLKEFGTRTEAEQSIAQEGMSMTLPSIDAERAKTVEVAFVYTRTKSNFSSTIFYNEISNAIEDFEFKGLSGKTYRSFRNSSNVVVAKGVEIEGKIIPIKNIALFGNYSLAVSENSNGVKITDVPTHKVNGGISHTFSKKISVTNSIIGKWIDGYRRAADTSSDYWYSIDYNGEMGVTKHLGFGMHVSNITDLLYKQPIGGVDKIPLKGREFTVSALLSF